MRRYERRSSGAQWDSGQAIGQRRLIVTADRGFADVAW